jgi:Domain of unknown function (DUF243)
VKTGPAQITKHFYVHEAPEEASNVRVEEKEILVRPQKHYKIIFIKAPSGSSSYAGSNAAVFPQVTKTLKLGSQQLLTFQFVPHRTKKRQLSTF